jgi:hypothetical protein
VVESPRFGWIGLAVVKPDAISAHDGQVSLQGDEQKARLVELPFDRERRTPIAAPSADPLEQL